MRWINQITEISFHINPTWVSHILGYQCYINMETNLFIIDFQEMNLENSSQQSRYKMLTLLYILFWNSVNHIAQMTPQWDLLSPPFFKPAVFPTSTLSYKTPSHLPCYVFFLSTYYLLICHMIYLFFDVYCSLVFSDWNESAIMWRCDVS